MQQGEEKEAVTTSLLTHPIAIALWSFGCVCSVLIGQPWLSVFFGFIFVLTSFSYIWGRLSLRNLGYAVETSKSGIFPGQMIDITRTLHNGKMLPLIWLELLEPCDANGCIMPERQDDASYCTYGISMLKWHQSQSITDTWTARRRGVFCPGNAILRSGDGFGLCVESKPAKPDHEWMLAVYPKLVEVSVDMALRNMWDTRSSAYGYLEDLNLLRSVRGYLPQDPARRINQRLLARGQGLKVNQYEVVTPNALLFILDAYSFNGRDAELETALSILASLIVGLCRRGVQTGLTVPASNYFPEASVGPSSNEAELAHMLELLAAVGSENKLSHPPLAIVPELIGTVYYIAYSGDTISSIQLLAPFPQHKTRVLNYEGIREFQKET